MPHFRLNLASGRIGCKSRAIPAHCDVAAAIPGTRCWAQVKGCRIHTGGSAELIVRGCVAPAIAQDQATPGSEEETLSEDDVSYYTPANYVAYTREQMCAHDLEVVVNADISNCFNAWNDWQNLVNFFDLIGQIGLDETTPHLGLFQCFYQWKPLPIMELTFVLSKTEVVTDTRITFESIWGTPMQGKVDFYKNHDGSTTINFYLDHAVPLQLIDFVGKVPIYMDIKRILSENLMTFKSLMEAGTTGSHEHVVTDDDCWQPPPDVTSGAEMIDRFVAMAEEAEEAERAGAGGQTAARYRE